MCDILYPLLSPCICLYQLGQLLAKKNISNIKNCLWWLVSSWVVKQHLEE